jgi:exonuclease III
MSQSAKWNQTLKICGITKLKSDIIFLSDLRVSNKNLVSAADDLTKMFQNNPYGKYEFHYNTTMNKRGVGILIKCALQTKVIAKRYTPNENVILLHVKIADTEVILISIYGPNSGDAEFFDNLSGLLDEFSGIPVIIGGDWNCCYSNDNLDNNIDCINMNRLPNAANTQRLKTICERFDLSDPFRFLHPDKVDFTYTPRSALQKNRSRLDFFIISEPILDTVSGCDIAESLQNKLFDHRAVLLTLNGQTDKPDQCRPTISNKDLDDDLLDFMIKISVIETYVIHCEQPTINGVNRNFILNTCGVVRRLIRECCAD